MAPLPASILSLLPRTLQSDVKPDLTAYPVDIRDTSHDPSSPMDLHLLQTRSDSASSTYNPGQGARPPTSFNNKGFLGLFALLGAAMVLTAIWFFFWARNGGFVWRSNDWDDYKSTVLRRKGPDGKTLSNATKSTKLGGGSVVHGQQWSDVSTEYSEKKEAKKSKKSDKKSDKKSSNRGASVAWDHDEERSRRDRRGRDPELAEYRHEKPAKVGGLNRAYDGSQHDYTNTTDFTSNESQKPLTDKSRKAKDSGKKVDTKKDKKERERRLKEHEKEVQKAMKAEAKQEKIKAKEASKAAKSSNKKDDKKDQGRSSSKKPRAATEFTAPTEYTDNTHTTYSDVYAATNAHSQEDSYYDRYRPQAASHSRTRSESRSPRKHHRHEGPSIRPLGPEDSVSQIGPTPKKSGGYRRGRDE